MISLFPQLDLTWNSRSNHLLHFLLSPGTKLISDFNGWQKRINKFSIPCTSPKLAGFMTGEIGSTPRELLQARGLVLRRSQKMVPWIHPDSSNLAGSSKTRTSSVPRSWRSVPRLAWWRNNRERGQPSKSWSESMPVSDLRQSQLLETTSLMKGLIPSLASFV